MSAGTLTLTNNSAAVTGAGTTFTTDLAAGDFIVVTVGGVPYTLPIKTVNSNTSLVLVSNYTGPTQSGAAWSAVPRVALNMVTAALVTQSAEALRGLNYDKQNWQNIFSRTGTVTVKLPDGSTWSGPAWNGITTTIAGKLDKSQNLSDLPDKPASRASLGLGGSSVLNTSSAETSGIDDGSLVATLAAVGLGANPRNLASLYNDSIMGFLRTTAATTDAPAYLSTAGGFKTRVAGDPTRVWFLIGTNLRAAIGSRVGSGGLNHAELYTTNNTTKSSDGTLKAASPVARIVNSSEECIRTDVAEDGYVWCGCGTANKEAEGINLSRLDVGVYALTGSAGLAIEGWQLLPPMDPGGMGELGCVEAEQNESGGLTIRLFKRKYLLSNEGEIVKTKGEPMDVPVNSWIDVRLDMPENSIWKKRQAEANVNNEKSDDENQQDALS